MCLPREARGWPALGHTAGELAGERLIGSLNRRTGLGRAGQNRMAPMPLEASKPFLRMRLHVSTAQLRAGGRKVPVYAGFVWVQAVRRWILGAVVSLLEEMGRGLAEAKRAREAAVKSLLYQGRDEATRPKEGWLCRGGEGEKLVPVEIMDVGEKRSVSA